MRSTSRPRAQSAAARPCIDHAPRRRGGLRVRGRSSWMRCTTSRTRRGRVPPAWAACGAHARRPRARVGTVAHLLKICMYFCVNKNQKTIKKKEKEKEQKRK